MIRSPSAPTVREHLLEAMPVEPQTTSPSVLARQTGRKRVTVSGTLRRMLRDGEVVQDDYGSYSLPSPARRSRATPSDPLRPGYTPAAERYAEIQARNADTGADTRRADTLTVSVNGRAVWAGGGPLTISVVSSAAS